jgi:DNA-binding transcriptional regulator YhcF (GntR family)
LARRRTTSAADTRSSASSRLHAAWAPWTSGRASPGSLPDIAHLHPGDALPTELELCERFGVSRMTARAGVKQLVDEGLLYRVRGRGTFVAQPPIRRQAGNLLSFSQEMRARGLRPSSEILELAQQVAPNDVARALGLPSGARVIVAAEGGWPTICRWRWNGRC